MSPLFRHRGTHIVISTTFVGLLAVPVVGPALPVMQGEFGIANRDIGWMVMSSYSLPAVIFVPLTGYLADRFGKKMILLPSLVLFALCGGLIGLAPDTDTLIALRFFQGIGASALATLNAALIPDLFSGRERVRMMGYTGATQSFGSGILPLIGGILASITWFLPFVTALLALPVGLYVLIYLENTQAATRRTGGSYLSHAWEHLADRRVIELCFFSFGFIFVGFGAFVSYIPSFMTDSYGTGPILIGIIVAARAVGGTVSAMALNKLTIHYSSRTLVISSFVLLAIAMASIAFVTNPWWIIFSAVCYGASFGITRPLMQVHLFEIAPEDLRSTFASANGLAVRIAQTIAPLIAGLVVSSAGFDALYLSAGGVALIMMIVAIFAKALKPEHTRLG